MNLRCLATLEPNSFSTHPVLIRCNSTWSQVCSGQCEGNGKSTQIRMMVFYNDIAEMDVSWIRHQRSHTSVPCPYPCAHTHWPAHTPRLTELLPERDQPALSCKARKGYSSQLKYKLNILYSMVYGMEVWSIVPMVICELDPCSLHFTVIDDFIIFYTSTEQLGIFVFST